MKLLIIGMVVLLTGCSSNNISERYFTDGRYLYDTGGVVFTNKEPRVFHGNYDNAHLEKLAIVREGYVIIGSSSFITSNYDEDDAISHAKKIKADAIYISKKYNPEKSNRSTITPYDITYMEDAFNYHIYYFWQWQEGMKSLKAYDSIMRDADEELQKALGEG
jgi:hypothetical protein